MTVPGSEPGPYHGLRVLDFSQGIAGPMACMLLADFGAEVLKVEQPAGDRWAARPGYLAWNRNKLRVTLDLEQPGDRTQALRLMGGADVAVFDGRPGELEALGLDGAKLCERFPHLLHVWLPPYGITGRWSGLPPDDGLLQALSGASWMQFKYEERPVYLVTPQVTYGQAAMAALAMAAAVYERERSGLGQSVVVSGLHGFAAVETSNAVRAGEMVRLEGRGSRGGVPHYQLYRCADGQWLFLATLSQGFFLRALEAMGLSELMAMEGVEGEFMNLSLPPVRERAIAILDARFAAKRRDEWLRILREDGVPCGAVGSREEWFNGPTVAAIGMRVELDHRELGRVAMPGLPVQLSATPASVRHLLREREPSELATGSPRPHRAKRAPADGKGPLAGVTVIDVAQVIAGPFGPTILASLGADVIKVESPDGDLMRPYGLGFAAYNRGKRGVVLDLKRPDGMEAFQALVRGADLVMDNFRPGVRERLGLDYETLRRINPRIITTSVTGYGTAGPQAADPGFDPLLQAISGLMEAQGGGDEPVFYQIAVNDNASAMMAAFGGLVALYAREKTGHGQEVQTSLAHQSVLFQSDELTGYEGRPPAAVGGLDCIGLSALRRLYRCQGEWLSLACPGGRLPELGSLLGLSPDLLSLSAEEAEAAPRDGCLAQAIARALNEIEREQALELLFGAGVPAAPALRDEEIFEDGFFRENGLFEEYDHPQFGRVTGIREYAQFSRSGSGFERTGPMLGEHTREVLREAGLDRERVEALLKDGGARQGESGTVL